jgi:hypothetical protein
MVKFKKENNLKASLEIPYTIRKKLNGCNIPPKILYQEIQFTEIGSIGLKIFIHLVM